MWGTRRWPGFVLVALCGAAPAEQHVDPSLEARASDAEAAACIDVTDTPITIEYAAGADEYALALTAKSASATSWGTPNNEALVLEVAGAHGLIGHLILHQGAAMFDYAMHLGSLAEGEPITVRVSQLSAPDATHLATVCRPKLISAAELGDAAEGMRHAPILRWPVQKRFDDIPLVVGWSKERAAYQSVMTNENGGTAAQCGGGAAGMQAEIARWGRTIDIEDHYRYGGRAANWKRCTGRVSETDTPLRMEGEHPILYYGDGHNRVFEDRSGYGDGCGIDAPEQADGDLPGWSTQNPGNELTDDEGRVIVMRPLPVALDALGYAQFAGRREALADHYAPWLYRLSALELAREGKLDGDKTLPMNRYLYVDLRVSGVGGSGDSYCSKNVSGGFALSAVTKSGQKIRSPQITAPYASSGELDWKRVAIALPDGVKAADIDHFEVETFDGDRLDVTAIGDAFIPVAAGDNGAVLEYVRKGETQLALHVEGHVTIAAK